jgi:5-formyltetrahydrofolate cyclo-ligase
MAANWNSVSVAKKSLRIQYLKSRANLDINYKIQSSAVISDYLKKIILPNSIVYAYHPITNEVDILPFMIELYSFNQNYSFALPLCFADKSCEFRKWDPAVPLVKNPMINVLEPAQVMPLINEPDVILVPMICFDQDLNRLGRGGGYYDRVLKNHPKSLKVGCAFSVQCTQSIPTESHDVSLDLIVTENGVLKK